MKKFYKSKAFKDKLRGHKDGVLKIYAPYGPDSGLLLSASKDGCIRGNLIFIFYIFFVPIYIYVYVIPYYLYILI